MSRIQLRRGTAPQWTAANPVLAAGEPGVETDTGRTKVGDGVTAWSALPYSGGTGAMPDATTTAKGAVQLAGDLAGTAAAPAVPGLAAKAADAAVVHLAGAETVTGAKNFTGGLGSGGSAVVVTTDARLSDQRTPTDGSVTDAKVAPGAGIARSKLAALTIVDADVSASAAIAEAKLALASDAAANVASRRTLGRGAQQAVGGTDPALSDARTPTAHGLTHGEDGPDPLYLGLARAAVNAPTRVETFPRGLVGASPNLTAGNRFLTYFRAAATLTISNITTGTGGGAAMSGPTTCRVGLFTAAANGDLTSVAMLASDTTMWAATFNPYTRPLAAANGYPASYTIQRGVIYAMMLVFTGTTPPNVIGQDLLLGAFMMLDEVMARVQVGAGDFTGAAGTVIAATALAASSANTAKRFLGYFS